MFSAEFTKWIVLILIITAIVFVIKAGMKIVNIIIMVLILGFCWYSFFTEEGCGRLTIMLLGKPVTAYTTKLEKQENLSNDSETYFISSKPVVVNGETKKYIKCYTKWIIRIPCLDE